MSVRHRATATIALTFSIAALRVVAGSTPSITGAISGLELCPQVICSAAVLAGEFVGHVNSKTASGTFAAAINHEPLPPVGESADITGGFWTIHTRVRTFSGIIAEGTLQNDGPPDNETQDTFHVTLTMEITRGGSGTLTFDGTLDHNPFPPTIEGTISSQ